MSRMPKWKSEKIKAKVVFRLQFYATHIPQPGWDKLFISFFSAETGKVTAKTTKANVRNGSCKWSDPIYETTKLFHDTRTKKYDEKYHKIVVAMGTTRSSILGEVTINLADYVDAFKPFTISLPLEECEFGTILHVTVQLLTSKTGFREFEKQREVGQKGFHMTPEHCIYEPSEKFKLSAETSFARMNKDSGVRFKSRSRDLSSREDVGGSNEDRGFDGSSCTSGSIYSEKCDINSTPEFGNVSTISAGDSRFPIGQTSQHTKEGSDDYTIANELSIACEENNRLRGSFEVVQSYISEYKMEVSSFQTLADGLSEETKNIVQQLAGELAYDEAMTKEVSLLKSECMKLKHELQELKYSKDMLNITGGRRNVQNTTLNQFTVPSPTRHSFMPISPITITSDLANASFVPIPVNGLESDSNNFLEGRVCELLRELEVSKEEKDNLTKKMNQMENYYEALIQDIEETHKSTLNELDAVKSEHSTCFYTISSFQVQIEKMHQDMTEQLSRMADERHSLNSLNKELERRANDSDVMLKKIRRNYSVAVDRLQKDLELLSCQVLSLFETNENFAKQAFAEAAKLFLNRPPCDDPDTAQMGFHNSVLQTTFHEKYLVTSENPSAIIECAPLKPGNHMVQHFSVTKKNRNIPLAGVSTEAEIHISKAEGNRSSVNDFELEKTISVIPALDIRRSSAVATDVIEDNIFESHPAFIAPSPYVHLGDEGEFSEMHLMNVNLEVLVKVLQETLHEKLWDIRSMKEEFLELSRKLNDSAQSNEVLTMKLQIMTKNSKKLLESEAKYMATSDDLCLRNRILEAKLQEFSDEKSLLSKRLAACQISITESSKDFETKYKTCDEEKKEFENLLKQESMQNTNLQGELQSIIKEYKILKAESACYVNDSEDLSLRNRTLDAKLQDVSDENTILSERLMECQKYRMKCKDLETNYRACNAEKEDVKKLLEQKSAQNVCIQGELETAIEQYTVLKAEYATKCSVIDSLEKILYSVNEKLGDLWLRIVSCDTKVSDLAFTSFSLGSNLENKNYKSIMMHIEQCLHEAIAKILQLDQENKAIEMQRNIAQATLSSTECNMQEFKKKLDFSSALAQKYQLELAEVAEKLKVTSEDKDMHEEKSRELSQRITALEHELVGAVTENRGNAKQLLEFDSIKEKLECTKLSATNYMHEKELLIIKVESGNQALIQLEEALCSSKERLRCADEGLQSEINTREKLEKTISELTFQLNEKDEHLLLSDKMKSEVTRHYTQISDLESHNMQLQTILLQSEECRRKLNVDASSLHVKISDLERMVSFVNKKLQDICSIMDSRTSLSINPTLFTSLFKELGLETTDCNAITTPLKVLLKRTLENVLEQIQEKKEIEEQLETSQGLLNSTESSLQDYLVKLNLSNDRVKQLQLELQNVSEKLNGRSDEETMYTEKGNELLSKIAALEYELQLASCENKDMAQKMVGFERIMEELERVKHSLTDCMHEKDNLMLSVQSANKVSTQMENDNFILKEKQKSSDEELKTGRDLRNKLDRTISELQLQLNEKSEQLLSFDAQKSEISSLSLQISELNSEKSRLQNLFLQSDELQKKVNDENSSFCLQVSELESEISSLKENLNHELHLEITVREDLESRVSDLILQLNERSEQLVLFDEQKSELLQLKQYVLDLESEKSHLKQILSQNQESTRKLDSEVLSYNSKVNGLEIELRNVKESLRSISDDLQSEREERKDVDVIIRDLESELNDKDEQLMSFVKQNVELDNARNRISDLEAETSELQNLLFQAQELQIKLNGNNSFLHIHVADLENQLSALHEYVLAEIIKTVFITNQSEEQNKQEVVEQVKLRKLILDLEDDIDSLSFSRNELDVMVLVLKSMLDEQKVQISLKEEYGVELVKLQEECDKLNYKLSEQILKTEEFKNLSIHFKEYSDKVVSEYLQIHEKKENEGVQLTMQESLRMAFVKEQCESEVQDLGNQLHASKMHGNELLLKLQNTLDEMEILKKNEVSHFKNSDKLSKKVTELEAELQTIMMNKRELMKAYDEMKAELECSSISFDCCKEEKTKVEGQLRESNEERAKFRVELDLMKRRMEILISTEDSSEQGNHDHQGIGTTSFGQLLGEIGSDVLSRASATTTTGSISQGEHGHTLSGNGLQNIQKKSKPSEDGISEDDNPETGSLLMKTETLLQEKLDFAEQTKQRDFIETRLEFIHEELERLKNGNFGPLHPNNVHHVNPEIQSVEKELLQLNKANENIVNMFPSFKEFPCSKNALGRVLALELEFAQALQTKKKPNVQFQSSFLKQHSDDDAIFQSFRDINELIKDMLEIKGRYTTVEAELKEMHSRYSDLSLQFAEVEGERQKLIMTLKNRTPREKRSPSSFSNSPSRQA